MKTGAELIADERKRQIEVEGYTEQHDYEHSVREFISAAISYSHTALTNAIREEYHVTSSDENDALDSVIKGMGKTFVWGEKAFKSTTCLCDLVKAGALIAAAIDRLKLKQSTTT